MFLTQNPDCSTGGVWEAYSSTKVWTLQNLNADNDIYIKVRSTDLVESTCTLVTVTHDTIGPTAGSPTFNTAMTVTNDLTPTITLSATDSPVEMLITQNADCSTDGVWETYNTSKAWGLLNTNSNNTIYVTYRDSLENESSCVSFDLEHDSIDPILSGLDVNSGTTLTSNSVIDLSMTSSGAPNEVYITDTAGCSGGGSWNPYISPSSWTLTNLNASNTVYVKTRDLATNESTCLNYTIAHDNTGPSSPSLSIDSGALYTSTTTSSLTISAGDSPVDMYVTNTATCSGGGSWETYSTSKAWTLPNTNAVNIVYIKFRDAIGNESTCASDSIIHDTLAPTSPSISIDAGAAGTNLTLTSLTLLATGTPTDMYVTNTATCSGGGSWETYNTSKVWTLTNLNATNTVYVKYRDVIGNESTCADDSIVHDNIGPSFSGLSIDSDAIYSNNSTLSLTMTESGTPTEMYISETPGCSGGSWVTYTTPTTWTPATPNSTVTVYVKLRDTGTNESTCLSESIIHDTIAPGTPSISINSGGALTNLTSATLTVSATLSPDQMYITNTAGCGSGGSWEAYSTSKSWTLPSTNAVNTVYMKFIDAAGNETACINDTITHDSIAPTSPTISINAGVTHASSTSATLNLSAVGASEMYVTDTSGCGSGGSWESYSTSKSWTLPNTNATNTVYAKYRDTTGNETSCINDTIVHDNIDPTTPVFMINDGDATAYSLNVQLSATADETLGEIYATDTAGCASGGTWQALTPPVNWTLTVSDGANTVYAKVKDLAGNETACLTDTINHVSGPPELSGLTISTETSSSVTLDWTSGGVPTQGFLIKYAEGSTAPADCVGGLDAGNVTSRKIISLNENTQYAFRVCAYLSSAHSTGLTTSTTTADASISNICLTDVSPQTACDDIGTGIVSDPYVICTHTQLNDIYGKSQCKTSGTYVKLGADIDLSSYTSNNFTMIGNFGGNFDGENHTISNWSHTGASKIGLFGLISSLSPTITNLNIENFNVIGTASVGLLVGEIRFSTGSVISNIKVLSSTVSGEISVAGVIGNATSVNFDNIYVAGTTVTGEGRLSGVVGHCIHCGIENIYSDTEVNVFPLDDSVYGTIGGVAGTAEGTGTLTNTFFTGVINANVITQNIGGIAGDASYISRAISTGKINYGSYNMGGIVGNSDKSCDQCAARGMIKSTGGSVGGVSGRAMFADVTNSYSTSDIVADSYFSSTNINDTNANNYIRIGGVRGLGSSSTQSVKYLYFSGSIDALGSRNAGGVVSEECADLQSSFSVGTIKGSARNIGKICGDGTITPAYDNIILTTSTCDSTNATCNTEYNGSTTDITDFYSQASLPYTGSYSWDFTSIWEFLDSSSLPTHQWEPDPVRVTATANSSSEVTINWKHRKSTTAGFIINYNLGFEVPQECRGGYDIGLTDNYTINGLSNYQKVSGVICSYDNTNKLGFPVKFDIRSQNSAAIIAPSNLSLTHSSNQVFFDISWDAGQGNGDKNGCRLEYYDGSSWIKLIQNQDLNCDKDTNKTVYLNRPMSNNWDGADIRLVRISDSTAQGTFPNSLNCSVIPGNTYVQQWQDEDCNGMFGNVGFVGHTVYNSPISNEGYRISASTRENFCKAKGFHDYDSTDSPSENVAAPITYCYNLNNSDNSCTGSLTFPTGSASVVDYVTCVNRVYN